MRIEYAAVRNIAAGHSANETYEIVVLGQSYEPEFKFAQTRNLSLDRSRAEVDLWGTEQLIDVVTDLIPAGAASAIFEEFLHSVAAGESFTIDLESDSSGNAVNPQSAIMESSGYRRSKPISGYVQYSFTVRV